MIFKTEHFGKWKCKEGPASKSRKHSKLAEIAKYISVQFYYNCFCTWEGKRVKGEKNSIQLYGSCKFFILFLMCFSKCIIFLAWFYPLGITELMEMQLSKVFKAFYLKTNEF